VASSIFPSPYSMLSWEWMMWVLLSRPRRWVPLLMFSTIWGAALDLGAGRSSRLSRSPRLFCSYSLWNCLLSVFHDDLWWWIVFGIPRKV